jgi:ComF family protein
MPRSRRPVCARCGVTLQGAFDAVLTCAACRQHPLAYEMARAPLVYAGTAQAAVRAFKYHWRWRIGRWLADEMAATARAMLPIEDIQAVVPVPLHWLKRRLRGADAPTYLAARVCRALEKPCLPAALRKRRWTGGQTRRRGADRFRNVRGAFVGRRRHVEGRTVLLIDDVLTSGATADACASALKDAGASAVFVLTAARTPRP